MADVKDTILLADGVPYVEGMPLWGRDGGPLWPDRGPADRVEVWGGGDVAALYQTDANGGWRRCVRTSEVFSSRRAVALARVAGLDRLTEKVIGELRATRERLADLEAELDQAMRSRAYWRSVAEAEAQPAGG